MPKLSLIGKILKNKSLPAKKEILESGKNLVTNLVKNPKKTIQEGLARDKLAVDLYRKATGNTRGQVTSNVLKQITKGFYKGGGKDLIVNTGGVAGSQIGSVAGLPGTLLGDLGGAAIVRKGLNDVEDTIKALRNVKEQTKGLKQSWYRKGKLVKRRVNEIKKQRKAETSTDFKKDTIGWGIGNSTALALRNAGSKIPLQGGIIAMNSVEPIYKAAKISLKVGQSRGSKEGIKQGLESAKRGLGKNWNIKRRIKKGNAREQIMVDSINKQLQNLPPLPPNAYFSTKLFSKFNRKNNETNHTKY